ncbi:MAG TPA: twin-arginine translocase subunit TatC [Candidatus Saccharimonadales bacterium]|nr:twin-arginine translocase subunit TatC [Candidatus Saccharimonadales bacterium]
MAKNPSPKSPAQNPTRNVAAERLQSFSGHFRELRRRLLFVAIAVLAGGALTYNFHDTVTAWLLAPANGQQFIFTTPGGGFDFLLRLCLYGGLLASIPALIYQLLRFLQPLIKRDAMRFVRWGGVASVVLAAAGIAFGYFIGLPAAMHFLLQGFSSQQITPLITIQSYLSFVLIYLVGCAVLFQIPLILILINRITRLKPQKLLKHQRWFIVAALVLGAVINPSPNIQDQLLLSIPMIIMYNVGILLIWLINRRTKKLSTGSVASESAYELQ